MTSELLTVETVRPYAPSSAQFVPAERSEHQNAAVAASKLASLLPVTGVSKSNVASADEPELDAADVQLPVLTGCAAPHSSPEQHGALPRPGDISNGPFSTNAGESSPPNRESGRKGQIVCCSSWPWVVACRFGARRT